MEQRFFATTAKGLEEALGDELKTLGIKGIHVQTGGVGFSGEMSDCYRANLWLRTANRVLMVVAEFVCDSPQSLYDGVRAVSWNNFLNPRMTIAVDCNLRDSTLTHSGFVALKAKDAIVDEIRDHCGSRPDVDVKNPDLRVNIHLFRNHCTVSLDTSGDPLDRRGYRLERTVAPLRETLAAGLLELSGWDGNTILVDPMCGSGTIPIEAALKASRCAPGLLREGFGFQRWPGFEQHKWKELVRGARQVVEEKISAPIIGSDISAKAIAVACSNAIRADVGDMIQFQNTDIRSLAPPSGPGVILFNPPYGQRLGEEEELKVLYKEIGDTMKQRCKGYVAHLFTGNLELAKYVGLKASRRVVLFNGPIECRLLKYELY
ncbi:23S rRNA (guanosine2445-2-N)-methyltransferase, putative [Geotalea daltonii FRC-32]|uniref:23S rRNA (Guanosine2445-2-N)-methyltransferase, putative n=1 Tax=Geotalea daltonii (strain DSM 22248 / JCM 15807 / FRC-32) TaxID=316067 RepID=B9M158_GEODF|nr:THUMP domain-containing protein [Geotalea daltonii]ACM19128.1 23S rRNA (guanosine2445-2-N)-methyltransferase, putative [Geotalea daltonii FRC-32]